MTPSILVTDKSGAPMRGFLSSNQTYYYPVLLSEMSPWLIASVVAAEDKRFFYHSGVDVQAILRAGVQNVSSGKTVSGASTITQQLVRAIEPRPKTWRGKISEAYQAGQWEKTHTKEEILEDYFNRIEFGNLTQGVQAASQFYFGVDAADLSLAQAAFLVGLIKSPTRYNPLTHFARAKKRQEYVLSRLKNEEMIEEEMYQMALAEPIILQAQTRLFDAPHFMQFVRPLLPENVPQVRTTLDKELQLYAEKLVKTYISKLSEENITNAAIVIVENVTGAVLTYIGSADFHHARNQGQVDGVRALRQPGSALKPFVYGLAFEKKQLSPGTLIADEDTFFDDGFRPRNYDEKFHGLVSARSALACSYNVPAVKVAEKIGAPALLNLLHDVGFSELNRTADFYGLGLSLGNGEVQLLHLTNAYATLARGGNFKPLTVAWEPLVLLEGKPHRVLSEQTSYLVSHILADNQARAAAFGLNSALVVPFEMAAKTGTSKDYKDNFALGYTPRWTIGVWVGNFDASPMRRVSGVTGAGPLLHDLAVYMQQKYPSDPFHMPDGITQVQVCTQTGLLAGPSCKHTQEEVFLADNLPAVCDGKHQTNKNVRIVSPLDGDIYQYDTALPNSLQKINFVAVCAETKCAWKLDGKKWPQTSCSFWYPLEKGKHNAEVFCGGKTDTVHFEVLK
ncbi:penicillin-binding protein 1C [Candidatus Avelusimicrobium luingense]|uniref:penicillin-binding protein 1C n=1 Tax=Candidatus Avelusimicrobium luingense TaxID=3416211 RepID=UPI003D0ABFF7